MFAPRYFAPRYFAPRYFPPVTIVVVVGGTIGYVRLDAADLLGVVDRAADLLGVILAHDADLMRVIVESPDPIEVSFIDPMSGEMRAFALTMPGSYPGVLLGSQSDHLGVGLASRVRP